MKNYYIIILFFISIFFASCTEVITVDVPQAADKLVVEGSITTETDSSYVLLTKTISYYSNAPIPRVSDAFVTVNSDTFFYIGNGYYRPRAPYKGVANTTYNLNINYKGNNYTASSTLAPMFEIVMPFQFPYHDKETFTHAGYAVSMNFLYTNNSSYTSFWYGFKNDIDTHGRDSLFSNNVIFDSRNSKLNAVQAFEIPFLRLQENDTALLVFYSCDLNTYNYYNQMMNNSQGGSPFSNPPANLPTNIRGGGLGLFAAQDVKRYRLRVGK